MVGSISTHNNQHEQLSKHHDTHITKSPLKSLVTPKADSLFLCLLQVTYSPQWRHSHLPQAFCQHHYPVAVAISISIPDARLNLDQPTFHQHGRLYPPSPQLQPPLPCLSKRDVKQYSVLQGAATGHFPGAERVGSVDKTP
jgi:hypothetical protein